MAHIATACITDVKSALAVAKALDTDILILTDKHYFKFLNTVHPYRPWKWETSGSWSGFHLKKSNGQHISGPSIQGDETVFIRPETNWIRD